MTDCQLKIFCLFNGDPEWYLKFTDYIDSSTTVLKYNGNKVTTAGIKEVVLGYGTRDYLDFNKDDSSYFITSGILSLTFTTKNFGADKTISKIGFSVGIL